MSNNSSLLNATVSRLTASEIRAYTFLLILEVTVVPVIVCGNLLIIVAVLRFHSLRNPSNTMIMSLAFADLMMGGIYLPLKILLSQQPQLFVNRVSCLVNTFLSFFCVTNAMSFLSLISMERFYAVQFPFHYHSYMTITRSLVWSFLVFMVSVVIAVPTVSGIDRWKPGKLCFTSNVTPRSYVTGAILMLFIISFLGFLSFLRVMAAEISIRLKDNARSVNEARTQDSMKATLMLTVYVFSIICWIPQLVYTGIAVFNPAVASELGLRSVSFLGICSSGVNCFIYGIKNRQFKAAFKKIFGCKTSSVDVDDSTRVSTVQTGS
ncbi:melatonin receptor type 1A-like [Gigantopelta aegis]|uniref:melatonin receptor type 1A-like n=1 Tax=Gigantopelta aegis TaxID=1735272 RepID=UPI001B88D375|nr:melatonin receptor type 1A-like [Gigantopelta aegis]